jgi:4-hydroxy-4-methyl-2-oxoglutarate aldolase
MSKNAALRLIENFTRPEPDQLSKFIGVPTGNICDAMGRLGAMDYKIQSLDSSLKMCGPAITVRSRPGDNLVIYKALEIARPGDVLVIATFGGLVALAAKKKGIAGIVCDGLCRDVGEIRALGLPVYLRGTSPSSPFKDGPGEINFPISCGGIPVAPGDIVAGDEDGVVVIPQREIAVVAKNLLAIQEKEEKMLAEIQSGKLVPSGAAAELEAKGIEIIK